ncbi:MAG: SAM-dependent DNA methyltransferase [Rhodothermales bacterium]|nr:SAM-dependent DNA methyltransferase [Rhodothermales bacterium]MBO6778688.1 SAM-dependent DNA methyltransferase [Rhodothermales bacterium]
MSDFSSISSFIWNVCDDVLRGLFKQHEYGDVILPFVVLRRLDCVLESQKDEVVSLFEEWATKVDDPAPIILNQVGTTFFNRSRYDLKRLTGDPNNIRINLEQYLDGYSHNVREIVENFGLARPLQKLHKNNRLFLFIEKFTEIDLHPSRVSNHTMGQIFEELLRRFSEMSNETSGEHYTPRDVVRLLVSLIFNEDRERLESQGLVRSVYDPCCGTGGMLSISKEWVHDEVNPDVELRLLGQELNPQTYSICKSDMLVTDDDPDNIRLGSSLSEDRFVGERFDYMITNPPYGVSWKSEKDFVEEEAASSLGRFSAGTPRSSDGQLLFLQHMISKVDPDRGSRIGIVFNEAPLVSGKPSSGESEIRRWIIENDWLEGVVRLPDQLFFNTGITTYLWIISTRKEDRRKGLVQLIDASGLFSPLQRSLGNKRRRLEGDHISRIQSAYESQEESEISKLVPCDGFGFAEYTVSRPVEGGAKDKFSISVPLAVDEEEYLNSEVFSHFRDGWVLDRGRKRLGYQVHFGEHFPPDYESRESGAITSSLNELCDEIDDSVSSLRSLLKGLSDA